MRETHDVVSIWVAVYFSVLWLGSRKTTASCSFRQQSCIFCFCLCGSLNYIFGLVLLKTQVACKTNSKSDSGMTKSVNIVLNVHRNHKAYSGRGEGVERGMEVGEEGDYRYTVTTRMTPALRWAATRAILMFH